MTRSLPRRAIVVSANSLWNIANFRGRLLAALADAGYSVAVAAPDTQEGMARDLPGTLHPLRVASAGLNPLQDGLLLISYLRLLRSKRPLAYLSFTAKPNIYGSLAARMLGIPALPNVSGLGTAFIRGGVLQRLISLLYRLAFRRAPVVFFQNGEDRDLFVRGRMVRAEQARLLPGSGVDLDHFWPAPVPEQQSGRPGCTFLFIGRLLGDKGVRELAGAARLVKEAHPGARVQLLGFIGSANRTAVTQNEVAEWEREGILEYLGTSDDVRPFLAAADAAVLPSYREGLPRALLEAAAMARPLIATDVPGNREVVLEGANGLLCEARSVASLADAMLRFIALPDAARQRMGEASRRMVEQRFSQEKVVGAYLDAIRDVTAGGRQMGGASG